MIVSAQSGASLAVVAVLVAGSSFAQSERRDRFRDCSKCPDMVEIPAGNFLRGSPPRRTRT